MIKTLWILMPLVILFFAPPLRAQNWEGNYSYQEKVEQEGIWSGVMEIKNCIDKKCDYDWSSGSEQSMCGNSGSFRIKDDLTAEDIVTSQDDKGKQQHETCKITFARSPSKNEIMINGDGDSCDELCGTEGARYFGVKMTRYYKASFDCSSSNGKLEKVDQVICGDPKLAELDVELSQLYLERKTIPGVTIDQKAWVKTRNVNCGKNNDPLSCLATAYQSRIDQLKKIQPAKSK